MNLHFDLISDLHTDEAALAWEGKPTSAMCVVAGDVARDRQQFLTTLRNLCQAYQTVLFIDGNEEHRWGLENLNQSYETLTADLAGIDNLIYLHDQVVIINSTAFVGTNAWTSFDYSPRFDINECQRGVQEHYDISESAVNGIMLSSFYDTRYLENSIKRLQTHVDVRNIVIVTHFVPRGELLEHDPDINSNYRLNTSVNSHIHRCLEYDTENKIRTWCFGHYHQPVDAVQGNVRYVCNPRGRHGTPWHHPVYNAKKISI